MTKVQRLQAEVEELKTIVIASLLTPESERREAAEEIALLAAGPVMAADYELGYGLFVYLGVIYHFVSHTRGTQLDFLHILSHMLCEAPLGEIAGRGIRRLLPDTESVVDYMFRVGERSILALPARTPSALPAMDNEIV